MNTVRFPTTLNETLQAAARVIRDPRLFVWSVFVFLIPFYIFHSGLPQPGDLLILPLLPLALLGWNGRLERRVSSVLRALAIFTSWVVLVNWGWAVLLGNYHVLGKDAFLLTPLYYIYNLLVVLIAFILYRQYRGWFLWLTLHMVYLSVLVQALASFVFHSGGGRGSVFFNNPNQLGFYALVSASVIALGKRRLGFGPIKAGIGVTACTYLALVSASRAAVAGTAILFVLMMFSSPKRIIAAAAVILGLLAIGGPVADAIEGTQQRIVARRYPDLSFFQERGYDRIAQYKEYWVFGAGEGDTDRFVEGTAGGGIEIHSSAGTVFFSYGIVGASMFLVFLYRVVKGATFRSMSLLIPALSYTVAHQGLRATSLWLLFALFTLMKDEQATANTKVATT